MSIDQQVLIINQEVQKDVKQVCDQGNEFSEQFDLLISTLNNFKTQITVLQQSIKNVEKNVKKKYKIMEKETIKNKIKVSRKPSGFAKPTKVTSELCEFMNRTEGSEIARTDVTKALISYIEENKLQNNENKKIILPDNKLKILLGIEEQEDIILTYFNIQKYMNKHFVKEEVIMI
jgi:upstream activation factor subunit UAF30